MANCYGSIPAPMDANGCVVPLDTKELVRKGETVKVYGFDYSAMLKAWFVKLVEYGYTRLGACTMPDSWERLEEDVRKTPREEREKGTRMAKISDEIREWVRRALSDEHMDLRELDALADRIDKELIELPRDRDGVPIHVGDTVYLEGGHKDIVDNINLSLKDEHSIRFTVCGNGVVSLPKYLTHKRPDSLELIANELEGLSVDSMISDINLVSACALDLAKRIRKLAKIGGTR